MLPMCSIAAEGIFTDIVHSLHDLCQLHYTAVRPTVGPRRMESQNFCGQASAEGEERPRPRWLFLLAGQLVGVTSAIICHPMTMVKYSSWSTRADCFAIFCRTLRQGGEDSANEQPKILTGVHTLYRGLGSTICREATFGAIFTFLRHFVISSDVTSAAGPSAASTGKTAAAHSSSTSSSTSPGLNQSNPFVQNFLAASFAVILSSPFNYIRNMQLAAPLDKPTPSSSAILKSLWREAFGSAKSTQCRAPNGSAFQRAYTYRPLYRFPPDGERGHSKTLPPSASHTAKIKISQLLSRHPRVHGGFVVADRLRIGWGTLRASFGMSVGALLYEGCMARSR
ncbi:mitochondrial carrier superfamily protein [Cystoisospora suis]|uniref:Mitochondrial carrier superfamily protein n=1 Tax=Cystoisospora suis TaxID=483139 RepID=A0A2C6LAX6_9APIC|nr:mitochondrial carrier superfamily protein [Cystoisospora suis]